MVLEKSRTCDIPGASVTLRRCHGATPPDYNNSLKKLDIFERQRADAAERSACVKQRLLSNLLSGTYCILKVNNGLQNLQIRQS